MAYSLAVRGIPNFSYLQYAEFEDMLEIFEKYSVMIRSIGYETAEIFNKDGKRVILYILPEEHSAEALQDMCGAYPLCMSPSKLDSSRLGSSGIGRAGLGQWQALDPSRFPGYEDAKKAHREACKRAALGVPPYCLPLYIEAFNARQSWRLPRSNPGACKGLTLSFEVSTM